MCVAMLSAFLLSPPPPAAAQAPGDLLTPAAADGPVTLADAGSFEAPPAPEIALAEVADARKELASAVSAGRFADGFSAALAAALLLLAIAP